MMLLNFTSYLSPRILKMRKVTSVSGNKGIILNESGAYSSKRDGVG